MTKNPITIDKDELAVKALKLMNEKKITSCVFIVIKIRENYWNTSYTYSFAVKTRLMKKLNFKLFIVLSLGFLILFFYIFKIFRKERFEKFQFQD